MKFFEMWKDTSDPHYDRRLAEEDESVDFEQIICPVNEGHMRPGKRITPLSVILPNLDLQDFVWTWPSDCLLTERVKELFEEAQFTGYRLEPVPITAVKRKKDRDLPLPELWELVTTGERVRAAASAGLYVKRRCDACGSVKYSAYEHGLPVDESTWDGSDFFRFVEWGGLFVTERVKDCIEGHGLSGVSFVQVEDMRWPEELFKP